MKNLMNALFTLAILTFIPGMVHARLQDTLQKLPAIIDKNTVLSGTWVVSQNTLLSKGAYLQIKEGTTLLFAEGVQLSILGNMIIEGTASNPVLIKSQNPLKPGGGFVISEISDGDLIIRNTRMEGLRKPLLFTRNWSRNNVIIENSSFMNNPCDGPLIEIQEQDEIMGFKNASVVISGNAFFNNSGSVFISDLNSARHQTKITSNVFSRNQFKGISSQGFFNTPLLINYMAHGNNPAPIIENNAVYDNFSSTYEPRNVKSRRVNICVTGSAANIDLRGNYLGATSNNELEATHQLLSEQFKVPFMLNSAPLASVPAGLHTHFTQFTYNNLPIFEDEQSLSSAGGIHSMKLRFSGPMNPENNVQLRAFFYDRDTLFVAYLQNISDWTEGNTVLEIELPEAVGNDSSDVFIEISGFQDQFNRLLPDISPSKKAFYAVNNFPYDVLNLFNGEEIITIEESILKQKIKEKDKEKILQTKKPMKKEKRSTLSPWEIAVFSGVPVYYGDLVSTVGALSFYNVRSAWGPSLRYHFNPRFSAEVKNTTFRISGSDNVQTDEGKNRGTGYKRNLSFRTTVIELSALGYVHFTPSDRLRTWIPGIHGGFTAFYFNPQGEYEGVWYNLRDMGTEGQTINGVKPYSRFSVGLPMGLHIMRRINDRLSMTISYTHTKLFTDYLDDVSTGTFPDADAMRRANPDNPDAAVYLSNPTNLKGQRSSSDDKDAYAYLGISFGWRLNYKGNKEKFFLTQTPNVN